MIHQINCMLYEGSLFKCAYCGEFGFFPFYPQMHDECWKKAVKEGITIDFGEELTKKIGEIK